MNEMPLNHLDINNPSTSVSFVNNILNVPDIVTIPYIEGDGIGKDITKHVISIVNESVRKSYGGSKKIEWLEVLAGEKAYELTGEWMPGNTLESFERYLVGLKGPLTTPIGGGIRSLNVHLRKRLDLYVCLRPVKWFEGVIAPILNPNRVDMTIFRENTEDIYAGIEWDVGSVGSRKLLKFLRDDMGVSEVRFPESTAFGIKPVSVEGTERLVRAAIKFAIDKKLPSVTLVHKGNIMKFTEGGFKNWGYALAEREFSDKVFTQIQFNMLKSEFGIDYALSEYNNAVESGKIYIKDVIADAFLQNALLRPEDYSVIATLNLNGDYISDLLAAMVGGIGIAPGANINYNTGHAIFEATHGTAPDIAGMNIANPSSMLLSAVMMLDYIGWSEAGDRVLKSMETAFKAGKATQDLARLMTDAKSLSTSEFSQQIISLL